MEKTNQLYQRMANDLIDHLVEVNGADWTVEYLLISGYSLADLLEFGFGEGLVRAIANQIGKRI